MYPYGNYPIQQGQFDYNPYVQHAQQELYDPNRQISQLLQLPQWQQLERRVNQLERQNERQEREIDQLQRRLQRVNQRLRVVENRLHIQITPFEGEF
jgi:predicted RNase H-like nuclease (RuvC/YqgF family)